MSYSLNAIKAVAFLFLLLFITSHSEILAQSVGPIPLDGLKVLDVPKSIKAPNGFQIFNSEGALIKRVDESGQVNAKAYVELNGNLFLISDWSFERLKNQNIAPNWMLIDGLKLGNQPPPDEVPVDKQTGSDLYQIIFPDSNDAQAPVLSTVKNSQLIYADEEWIIVGRFVRDQGVSGYHYLSAYRANTLRLAFQLKIFNYIFAMDWSPERQQFLAVTQRPLKWTEVEPSVLVIDLPSRQIKRLNYHLESKAWPHWEGNRIFIEYKDDVSKSVPFARFSGDAFSDILIQTRKVNEAIPSLSSLRKEYEKIAALDLVHLTGFSDSPYVQNAGVTLDLATSEEGGLRILRTTELGHAVDLNLGELRIKRLGDGKREIDDLSLMDGGIVGFKIEPSTVRFIAPGKVTEVDYGSFWNDESKFGYSHDAAIVVGPNPLNSGQLTLTQIHPDGQISHAPIKVPESEYSYWTLHPDRESIVTLEFVQGPQQLWREISWYSGEQVGELYRTEMAKGFAGRGRVFGQSEGNWTLTSSIYDVNTFTYHYTVEAKNRMTGKLVSLDDKKYLDINGDDPLHLFHASNHGFTVLCAGADKIYLYRYNAIEDRVTLDREWDKNPAHGNAAFDRHGSRLFVPRENGYEVFLIKEQSVSKAFDLYFYGDSAYAVVLPDGFYAGSPGCESFLSLLSGVESVDASALALWRNRPGRVIAALGGSSDNVSALEKVTERWLARREYGNLKEPSPSDLPKIGLREPMPLKTSQSELTIPCRLLVGSVPLREVSISVNGVDVKEAGIENPDDLAGLASGEHWDGSLSISLSSGQNWIELTAVDEEGRTGEPVRFRIICEGKPSQPRRFVVAMGVSKYADSTLDLDLAAKDAEDVSEMFSRLTGVSETKTLVLTDSEATASALSRIKEFLAPASVDDEVIFFGAAHGVLDENLEYVFCTHDFDPADASNTGIKLNAIVAAIRKGAARKCLILLDTCQAGAVGERDVQLLASNSGPAMNVTSINRSPITTVKTELSVAQTSRYIEEMFLMPGTLEGIHIIGASSAAGFALELEGILNGVFTSALIEALQSGKADINRDRSVSIDELKEYLDDRVTELTSGAQRPSIVASERDQRMQFPVGSP